MSPRIVNGVETAGHPAVGAMLYARYGHPVTQYNALLRCSGTLIGCRTFLTAAHCITDPRPGAYAVYLQHAGIFEVEDFAIHPGYDQEHHDLAILKLKDPVPGIDSLPINSTHDLSQLGTGLEGTIVGFGRVGGSSDWQYEYGIKRQGRVKTAACDPELTDGEGLICYDFLEPLGPPGEDSSTCHGDSGGPLLLELGGQTKVAGVALGGTADDCLPPSESALNDAFAHADWILDHLSGDSTGVCGGDSPVGSARRPVFETSAIVGQAPREWRYRIPVQDHTSRVVVTFNGADDGDFGADLFVRKNAEASATSFDCATIGDSLFGACEMDDPPAGYLSVLVASTDYAGRFQLTVVQDNGKASVCGNATLELDEECDGADVGRCTAGPCSQDCTCPDPVCGNGTLETGEQCDDDNLVPGDGCDASCVTEMADHCEDARLFPLFEGNWTLRGDTTGLTADYAGCSHWKDPDAWYRFFVESPSVLSADTDDKSDLGISIYRGDCDGYLLEGCDGQDGAGPGASVSGIVLDPGEYILLVEAQDQPGPFELTLSLVAPGCGNGVVEFPEYCDGLNASYCTVCQFDCTCAPATCGDGFQDSQEYCDGADLGDCEAGPCTADCECPEPVCGNGRMEWQSEQCDGYDDAECYPGTCGDDCMCDYGVCGNDVREGYEDCDGDDLGYCSHGPCIACTCPEPYCGNGLREWDESCDGEDLGVCNYGPCAGDCTCPPSVCGNGDQEFGELCDGEDNPYCVLPCTQNCQCPEPVCGNGIRESGEQCDEEDGFCVDGACTDGCKCPPPVCGNGIWQYGEDCDGEDDEYCYVGSCLGDCTCPDPVCGNGIVESGEECDSPNLQYCDRGPCTQDCQCPPPVCGNGVIENGEACDGSETGECPTGACTEDCECPAAVCGNDVQEGQEHCDGTDIPWCSTGSCEPDCTCTPPVCGDGVAVYPEECDGDDPGYCNPARECTQDCKCPDPVCGNSILESGEYCDTVDKGSCAAGPCDPDCTCPTPICGNGILENGEQCDGEVRYWPCVSGTICDDDCTCPSPICGNGIVEPGESCDGTKKGSCPVNPCDDDCTCPPATCGNNVVEQGEQCDGYRIGSCEAFPCEDDCSCPPPVCGNNIVEQGEECDASHIGWCDEGPCGDDCTCPPPVCGDGEWDWPEEDCDGSNPGSCDYGCGDDCQCLPPICGNGVRESGEECDGDDLPFWNCSDGCKENCTCVSYCGDDEVSGTEECEGYNAPQCATGICNVNSCVCIGPQCGDSIVQGDETCDGANLGDCPTGPCRSNCRCPEPVCGNGVLEAGESCEDGEAWICGEEPCDDCACGGGSQCESAATLPDELDELDGHSQSGTTAEHESDGVGCGGTAGERWYRFELDDSSIFHAWTDGQYDSYLTLFRGSCGALSYLDCDDDGGEGLGSSIGPMTLAPGKYLLLVDGHGADEGDFTLELDVEKWTCCDADDSGLVTTTDALRILRKSVGISVQCPVTRCDPTGDRKVTTVDALATLRMAVGIPVRLYCPLKL